MSALTDRLPLANGKYDRFAWPLGLAGALLMMVSTLLTWSYDPNVLGDLTVPLYPGAVQFMFLGMAVLALFLLLVSKGPFTRFKPMINVPAGLGPLSLWALAFASACVASIALSTGALANTDPGMWMAVVGALLLLVSTFIGAPESQRELHGSRLPEWAELALLLILVAVSVFVIAYALALHDPWVFTLFLLMVSGVASCLAGIGWFTWLGVIAAHHRRVLLLSAFVAAFLFPLTQNGNDTNMAVATSVLVFAATAMGLNIVVGLAGLLDLGYIAFLGAGAYVAATMSNAATAYFSWKPHFLVVVLIAACFSAVLGLIIGSPTLRVSGDYLAIVTLAFGEIFRIVMNNLDGSSGGPNITGGPNGVSNIPELKLFGFDFGKSHFIGGLEITRTSNYYLVMLLIMALIMVVFTNLNDSRIGRGWVAIREDEKAAEAMGVNVFALKLLAFATGAFLAGLAGAFKAHYDVSVTPDQYTFLESAFLLAAVVLGGMGTVGGVIIGAVVLKMLPEKLRFFSDYRLLLFGLLLVLMMRFRPEGIVPSKRRKLEFHEDDTVLAEKVQQIHLEEVK